MKAFVSYQHGANIYPLFDILRDYSIDFFDTYQDVSIGSSFQEALANGIRDCDFFVVVYQKANPNIAFETGLAVALKKPIFAIINTEEISDFPDFLLDSVHVQSEPSEYEKIRYNFEIFLKNIKPKKHSIPKSKKQPEKLAQTDWVDQFNSLNIKNEISLEKFINEVLSKNKVDVIKNNWNNKEQFIADFCIWSDSLNNILGNPILIEIKKTLNKRNLKHTHAQITKAINQTNAKFAIVIYVELNSIEEEEVIKLNSPRILFVNILELLERVEKSGFNKAVLDYRNKMAHNSVI